MDAGMIERIKAVLMKPRETWGTIAGEADSPAGLVMRWAVPLAAIRPLATFLHGQVFGYGAFGFSYKPSLMFGLSSAVVQYVLSLIGVAVLALVAEWLAPKFGGEANRTQAFKLVVYGSVASWLAGVFGLLPGLGVLGLLGLYSLYLFYTGAAPVMKVPEDKAIGYIAVMIVCAIVVYVVVAALGTAAMGIVGGGASGIGTDVGGRLTLPNGG